MINSPNIEKFEQVYRAFLEKRVAADPNAFRFGAKETGNRVMAHLRTRGLQGMSIDSETWKQTAKELGIRNTYEGWRVYFGITKG